MPIINAPSGDTVGQLLDRITSLCYGNRRLELNRLAAGVAETDADTDIDLTYDLVGWGRGTVLEIGLEAMYVWSADLVIKQATVSRGHDGHGGREHASGDIVRVNPVWSRRNLYDALLAEVRELNGTGLFAAMVEDIDITSDGVGEVPVVGSEIIGCYSMSFLRSGDGVPLHPTFRFVPRQDVDSGGRVLVTSDIGRGETVRATLLVEFADFASEADVLGEVCQIPEYAIDVLVFGAAARVFPQQEAARIDLMAAVGSRSDDAVPVTSAMRVSEQFYEMKQRSLARALGHQLRLFPLKMT